MGSVWGNSLKISVFGESHGEGVGVVIDGLPHGILIDIRALQEQMSRRVPGTKQYATPRKESDIPHIVSGILDNRTTGAPLCAMIPNQDTRSSDYRLIADMPRPSHSDWTAYLRYAGHNDVRGGGHFSGRLTAPLVFAGALARQILGASGISIGGRIVQIGSVADTISPEAVNMKSLIAVQKKEFPVLTDCIGDQMLQCIEEARLTEDSVGGILEITAFDVPAGWGNPMFDTVEGRLAQLFFGVPAIKGIEFGSGFSLGAMRGSEANDSLQPTCPVTMKTNHSGGVNGGITNGMPLLLRAVVRPTPSIGREQDTICISTGESAVLKIQGRHDPCIVPRVLPVLEAVMAIGLLDLALDMEGRKWTGLN